MKPSIFVFRRIVPCIAALLGWSDVSAVICTPLNAPPPRFVGDTGSDQLCTDDTIQSAIDFIKNAAYACPATIYVTREHTYTSQHLTLNNVGTPLTIVGTGDQVHCGSTDVQICDPDIGCPPPPTAPLVTIDGSASNNFSVLSITGYNNITLRYLTIKGAAATGDGGGIHFDGTGFLTIDTSTISLNEAGYGGGINFKANGGAATLTLAANALVLNNTADTSGGGIRIEGQAHLFALQPQTLIAFNHALGGYGGGVEVVAPAVADIGSPGYNGGAVIQFNDAQYGGGIAVAGYGQGGDYHSIALARLFTVDPVHPVQVTNNSASHTGGGIWLKPQAYLGPRAELCANDFRIDDNIAAEGSAIYSDSDYNLDIPDGGEVYLNLAYDDPDCSEDPANPDPVSGHGAVACASGVACNTLDRNIAEDDMNVATDGSVILVQDSGSLRLNRTALRNNQGGHAIRLFGTGEPYADTIFNCLLAENAASAELIRIEHEDNVSGLVSISGCTIANNDIGGATVVNSAHALTFTKSIVAEPDVPTLAYTDNPDYLTVQYVLSNDVSTLPASIGVLQGAPTFVDAAGSDYHLQNSSIGIDYAPASGGIDLDGVPRSTDLPQVPDNYGTRDLGAYERQYFCGMDTIFCSGFDF